MKTTCPVNNLLKDSEPETESSHRRRRLALDIQSQRNAILIFSMADEISKSAHEFIAINILCPAFLGALSRVTDGLVHSLIFQV